MYMFAAWTKAMLFESFLGSNAVKKSTDLYTLQYPARAGCTWKSHGVRTCDVWGHTMGVTRVSMPRSYTDCYEQNICSLCTLNYTCSRASYTSHVSSSMQQDVDRIVVTGWGTDWGMPELVVMRCSVYSSGKRCFQILWFFLLFNIEFIGSALTYTFTTLSKVHFVISYLF